MMISTDPADIAENRQGRLSQAQIAAYDRATREWVRVRAWLVPFLFVTFFAAAAILGNSHAPAAIIAFAIIEALALWGSILLARWMGRKSRMNVMGDRVVCKIGRLTYIRRSRYLPPRYYLRFGDDQVLGAPVKAIKPIQKQLEKRPHRIYHLSHLGNIVAIEPE